MELNRNTINSKSKPESNQYKIYCQLYLPHILPFRFCIVGLLLLCCLTLHFLLMVYLLLCLYCSTELVKWITAKLGTNCKCVTLSLKPSKGCRDVLWTLICRRNLEQFFLSVWSHDQKQNISHLVKRRSIRALKRQSVFFKIYPVLIV